MIGNSYNYNSNFKTFNQSDKKNLTKIENIMKQQINNYKGSNMNFNDKMRDLAINLEENDIDKKVNLSKLNLRNSEKDNESDLTDDVH